MNTFYAEKKGCRKCGGEIFNENRLYYHIIQNNKEYYGGLSITIKNEFCLSCYSSVAFKCIKYDLNEKITGYAYVDGETIIKLYNDDVLVFENNK